MNTISIQSLQLLLIKEGQDNHTSYGAQQRMFPSKWKQASGCGPTAASNLIIYEQVKDLCELPMRIETVRHMMLELWKYVTPGIMGVNSMTKFEKGLKRYCMDKELPYVPFGLEIHRDKSLRISERELKDFLSRVLSENKLVAFLNLDAAKTAFLDEWHWVVLHAIHFDEDHLEADILDGGKSLRIDLKHWLENTKNHGAFVVLNKV